MWDLGDGPPVVGETVEHRYAEPGTYRVTLLVWDSTGRAARAEHTLEIHE
jgi:PKD repeat protein